MDAPAEEEPISKLERLRWAAEDGDIDVLKALLTRQNVNYCDPAQGVTLLAVAAAEGREDAVRATLEAGAIVDVCDRDGWRALHRAVWGGHLAVVRLLVEAGSSLRDKGRGKAGTVLGLACQRNQREIVEYLLQASQNAVIDGVDQEGFTALSRAAAAGHTEMVQLLLQRGASRSLSNPRDLCQKRASSATTQQHRLLYQNLVSMISHHQTPQSRASVS